jgi:hypothetical protein
VGPANHVEIDQCIRWFDAFLANGDAHRAARDARTNRAHNLGLHRGRDVSVAAAHLDVAAPAIERTNLDDQPPRAGFGGSSPEASHAEKAGAYDVNLCCWNHARVFASPATKSTEAV